MENPCPPGKVMNPATKRCRKLQVPLEEQPCPPGKVRHPETKRCRTVKAEAKTFTPETLWKSDDPKDWKYVLKRTKLEYIPKLNMNTYSKEDHIKLLHWKMKRGQWRPMLMKYAIGLTEEEVQKVLQNVNAKTDYKAKIKEFSKLKGVGVALASAFISARDPKNFPFMSDILIKLVCDPPPKYNMKEYEQILEAVRNKGKLLKLTCAQIEQALATVET